MLQQIISRFGIVKIFVLFVLGSVFFSCSLNYGNVTIENAAPEFILHKAFFTQKENGKINSTMFADTLELYRIDNSIFGKNIEFTVYEQDSTVNANGKTAYFYANRKQEIYALLGGVQVTSVAHDVQINAENLKWNNKTEQMTSPESSQVSIIRGGQKENAQHETIQTFTVSGFGFSADAAKQSFAFLRTVNGTISEGDK